MGLVGLRGAGCRCGGDHEGTIPRGGWLANAEMASGDNTLSPRGEDSWACGGRSASSLTPVRQHSGPRDRQYLPCHLSPQFQLRSFLVIHPVIILESILAHMGLQRRKVIRGATWIKATAQLVALRPSRADPSTLSILFKGTPLRDWHFPIEAKRSPPPAISTRTLVRSYVRRTFNIRCGWQQLLWGTCIILRRVLFHGEYGFILMVYNLIEYPASLK